MELAIFTGSTFPPNIPKEETIWSTTKVNGGAVFLMAKEFTIGPTETNILEHSRMDSNMVKEKSSMAMATFIEDSSLTAFLKDMDNIYGLMAVPTEEISSKVSVLAMESGK